MTYQALAAHAGNCPGGEEKSSFLPRPSACQQFGGGVTAISGIGLIDAFHGDGKHAIFEPSHPSFRFQIPEMKLEMLARAT